MQRFHQPTGVFFFQFFESWYRDSGDFRFGKPNNLLQATELTAADKTDGFTAFSCPARSSDAMHIIFGVMREFVIKHNFEVIDIQTSCRNICRNQQFNFSLAKSLHGPFTHRLRHVTMQFVCTVSSRDQCFCQSVDLNLGKAED